MNTIAEYIRAGYEIRSSHGGGVDHHYIVMQRGESVIVAQLPRSKWSGRLKHDAGGNTLFVEVSS